MIRLQDFRRFQDMELKGSSLPALLPMKALPISTWLRDIYRSPVALCGRTPSDIVRFYGILKPQDGVVPYRLEMQRGPLRAALQPFMIFGEKLFMCPYGGVSEPADYQSGFRRIFQMH